VAGGSVLMLTCSQVVGDVDVMWSWVRDECGRDTSGDLRRLKWGESERSRLLRARALLRCDARCSGRVVSCRFRPKLFRAVTPDISRPC
jgi:hypothetical protein